MHIGGSGMHAEYNGPASPPSPFPRQYVPSSVCFSQLLFLLLGIQAQMLCRLAELTASGVVTLRWLSLWALCTMLFQAGTLRAVSPAKRGQTFVQPVPLRIVLALGGSQCSKPLLNWTPWVDRKGRPKLRKAQAPRYPTRRWTQAIARLCQFSMFLRFIIGLEFMVAPVIAMVPQMPSPPEPQEFSTLPIRRFPVVSAAEMPLRKPIGSRVGISSVGFPPPGGPYVSECNDELWPAPMALPCRPAQTVDLHRALRIDSGTPILDHGPDGAWLGLTLFAPYFHSENWALHVPGIRNASDLIEEVRFVLKDAFHGYYDTVAPLVPQRLSGIAMFIAYPKLLNHDGDRGVAVVFDLSRVGGGYFASIVDRVISHADLTQFVMPLATHGHEDFLFYVGDDMEAKGPGADMVLFHGTVVTALSLTQFQSKAISVEELFAEDAEWCLLQHLPTEMQTPSICAMCGNERFLLRQDYHIGRTIAEAVSLIADCIGMPCAMATSFEFSDLAVHGSHCDRLVAFSKLSADSTARQDFWIFCDYRPLGKKPMVYLSHASPVSLRTLLLAHQITIPPGQPLFVRGVSLEGDRLLVGERATVVFTVEETASAHPVDPQGDTRVSFMPPVTLFKAHPDDADGQKAPKRTREAGKTLTSATTTLTPQQWMMARQVALQEPPCYELKQPDTPGDVAHAATAAGEGQTGRLQNMLDSPLVRDGPTVPVNPEELMRIRVGGDQDPPRATADTLFLVYPPDHTPEVLYMPLDVPCSIPEALQAVAECRDPDLGLQFPEIVIPAPQPSSSFAVLIAMPSWAIERIVVMFDCRRVNGSLFPMIVPERLNRESLCAFAKVPSHAGIEVFVRDVPWALAPWQMSELETGDLITISPLGYGPPRRRGLETMLASTEFWDPQVAIPAPPGTFYLLLSDGIPQLFHMPPQHRELLRERIAAALSISEQNMTIRGPRVPIEHAMFRGHFLASVLITTEAVHRLPIPPARLHASQWLLFLDLRRILRGFSWRLLDSCHVDVRRLMREFEHLRPVGYIASITGAPIDALADGPAFRIDSGDTLTVEFIPDYLEEGEESQDEPGDDDPWDPHEDESSDTGSDDDGDPTPPGAAQGDGTAQASGETPFNGGAANSGPMPTASSPQNGTSNSDLHMWWLGFRIHNARPAGHLLVTSVLLASLICAAFKTSLCAFACILDVLCSVPAPMIPFSLSCGCVCGLACLCHFRAAVNTQRLCLGLLLFCALSAVPGAQAADTCACSIGADGTRPRCRKAFTYAFGTLEEGICALGARYA